jgi:hypothetical protein
MEKKSGAQLTDSAMGAILVDAVDRRGGTKSLKSVTNSWNDHEADAS